MIGWKSAYWHGVGPIFPNKEAIRWSDPRRDKRKRFDEVIIKLEIPDNARIDNPIIVRTTGLDVVEWKADRMTVLDIRTLYGNQQVNHAYSGWHPDTVFKLGEQYTALDFNTSKKGMSGGFYFWESRIEAETMLTTDQEEKRRLWGEPLLLAQAKAQNLARMGLPSNLFANMNPFRQLGKTVG